MIIFFINDAMCSAQLTDDAYNMPKFYMQEHKNAQNNYVNAVWRCSLELERTWHAYMSSKAVIPAGITKQISHSNLKARNERPVLITFIVAIILDITRWMKNKLDDLCHVGYLTGYSDKLLTLEWLICFVIRQPNLQPWPKNACIRRLMVRF